MRGCFVGTGTRKNTKSLKHGPARVQGEQLLPLLTGDCSYQRALPVT